MIRETREEVEEALDLLSSHFAVLPPTLAWSRRTRRGNYRPLDRRIAAGPCCWAGFQIVLHEFAHHLDYVREWRAAHEEPRVTRPGSRTERHGATFRRALLDVVSAWYGDPSRYDWDREYPPIRSWAVREGFLEASPVTH